MRAYADNNYNRQYRDNRDWNVNPGAAEGAFLETEYQTNKTSQFAGYQDNDADNLSLFKEDFGWANEIWQKKVRLFFPV